MFFRNSLNSNKIFKNTSPYTRGYLSGMKLGYTFNNNFSDFVGVKSGIPTTTGLSFGAGKIGNAVTFNGSGIITVPPINTTTTFTFNVWLNLSTQTGLYDCLLSDAAGSSGFYRKQQKISFFYNSADHLNNTDLVNGVWYMITITCSAGANVSIYINSVLDSNIFSGYTSNFLYTKIGGNNAVENLNGSMNYFFLWDRVLSNTEINDLYNNGNGREFTTQKISRNRDLITKGSVLWLDASNQRSYPGSGSLWTDLSGNGNNATLINSPSFDNSIDGGILSFNNTALSQAQRATIPDSPSLNFGTGDFTISCVARHSLLGGSVVNGVGYGNGSCIIYKGARFDNPIPSGYLFVAHAGINMYHVVSNGTTSTETFMLSSTTNFDTATVFHYVRRDGILYQYKNGLLTQIIGASNLNINSTAVLNIAHNPFYGGYLPCKIQTILMYNRGLSDGEIFNNYIVESRKFTS